MQFSSGLSINIPNDQLVVPDTYINRGTGALVANATQPDFVINAIEDVNKDDLSQLGRTFLSSAYIMVNQDAGLFTMWQANPTPNQDLVAIDATGNEVSNFCAINSSAGTNSSTSTDSSSHSSGSSVGPIAGGVVGGVAAVVILVGASFWYWKRKAGNGRGEKNSLVPTPGHGQPAYTLPVEHYKRDVLSHGSREPVADGSSLLSNQRYELTA